MQAFESEESDDGSPLETFEDETRQEDTALSAVEKGNKKRRNRKNQKSSFVLDDTNINDDPLSSLVDILAVDMKGPQKDSGMHIIELQAQQKMEEEKTKQLELNLQLKKMEYELALLQQQK